MKKKIFAVLIGIIAAAAIGTTAFALEASYVDVANNVGNKDVVTVNGIEPKSTVSVYNEKGMLLGQKTATTKGVSATVNLTLPSADGGKIVISVLEKGATEPETVEIVYPAEPVSNVPSNVEIVNNVGKKDTITVDYLESRDKVIVYANETGSKKLATGTVKKDGDEVTLSNKQLGTGAGSVWISVTSTGMLESARVRFDFAAEKKSDKITDLSSIVITNNVNKKSTIEVSGLESGEAIVVYSAETGTKKFGSAKCSKNKSEIKISNVQLTKEAGTVWMTIKRANELESDRFPVSYDKQAVTPKPTVEDKITMEVTNNPAGISDTIYFDGLEAGDIIKIYSTDDTSKTTVYLKGTVASGKTEVTLKKAQLGANGATLWITNTRKNMLESDRVVITIPAEQKSDVINTGNVTITNNAGIASTIYVTGLSEGTTITVYDKDKDKNSDGTYKETGGKSLGSGKVAAGSTSVTISTSSLGITSGTVWISRKDPDLAESNRVELGYDAKRVSEWSNGFSVDITYNSGKASTITVSGLEEGDTVKAYSNGTTGTAIGQATRTATDFYSVTISTTKLSKDGGEVYLTITRKGEIESARHQEKYDGEVKSGSIIASNVEIEYNTNSDSVITVYGVSKGDTITVYAEATGTRTICKGTAEASYITFYTSSLSSTANKVWISRLTSGYGESERTEVGYTSRTSSSAISSSNVTIVNYIDIPSVITVTGLNDGDTVKVYDSATATEPIVTGTAYGTVSSLSTKKLSDNAGKVYISVISNGSSESTRTAVSYSAVEKSKTVAASAQERTSSSVVLNIEGNIEAGDEVCVYSDKNGTVMVGYAYYSVKPDGIPTITISALSDSSGVVYVTRISSGLLESSTLSVSYQAKP